MTLKRYFSILILLCCIGAGLYANPIVAPTIINEFGFTPGGWKIELHIQNYSTEAMWQGLQLDSVLIISTSDTAYIKPGLTATDSTYLVLMNDDLTKDLYIDPNGDLIIFGEYEWFRFGSKPDAMTDIPVVLEPNESIGVYLISSNFYRYYLDSSPTFGAPNDTTDAMGYLSGVVVDSSGNPIAGASAQEYLFNTTADSLTDEFGHFTIRLLSGFSAITIQKNNYENLDPNPFIYPDSTVIDTFTLTRNIQSTTAETGVIRGYFLEQNYPNPFNATTSFTFHLPQETHLEVAIYDLHGRLVEELFQGRHAAGRFAMTWNAENAASGVYYYRIKTPETVLQKKCILLK